MQPIGRLPAEERAALITTLLAMPDAAPFPGTDTCAAPAPAPADFAGRCQRCAAMPSALGR